MQKKATPRKLALTRETLRMLNDLSLWEVHGEGVVVSSVCPPTRLQVTACSACPSCTL
jgi:hypothetical protein